MAKYRRKLKVVEATRWFRVGDHPQVNSVTQPACLCGAKPQAHGYIHTRVDNRPGNDVQVSQNHLSAVCPGDWIITGEAGMLEPMKPDIFEATYEAVDDDISICPSCGNGISESEENVPSRERCRDCEPFVDTRQGYAPGVQA